jgi:tRNA dimethylallyltransferase
MENFRRYDKYSKFTKKNQMKKILIISGPTATGKTNLALSCAQRFNGELISADSRQVYKHMDVVTGKDIPINVKLQRSNVKVYDNFISYYGNNTIRIWGLDIVEPNEEFSVKQWVEYVRIILGDVWKRDKLPIIVGGTGFYLSQLCHPSETITIPKNDVLRKKIENYTVADLFSTLSVQDPQKAGVMNDSDRKNPRRLIRAIEIATYRKEHEMKELLKKSKNSQQRIFKYIDTKWIGLTIGDRKELYKRIDDRVEKRLGKLLDAEINYLKDNNLFSFAPLQTIGYREWYEYIKGKITKEHAILNWKKEEHAYAKRQMTWFRKIPNIQWFDCMEKNFQPRVINAVNSWYTTVV